MPCLGSSTPAAERRTSVVGAGGILPRMGMCDPYTAAYLLGPKHFFMKPDPELPYRFANAVLEELALIRGELIAQRKLLIELASCVSKERRRTIKDRTYDRRLTGLDIAKKLKGRVKLPAPEETL